MVKFTSANSGEFPWTSITKAALGDELGFNKPGDIIRIEVSEPIGRPWVEVYAEGDWSIDYLAEYKSHKITCLKCGTYVPPDEEACVPCKIKVPQKMLDLLTFMTME